MSEPYKARPGSFTLFPNRWKKEGDNKPDFTGNGADLHGTPLNIAAWWKVGGSGIRFLSVAITTPQQKVDPPPAAQSEPDDPF
jgi:uncharacterized protein (DUF736 family)